MNEDNMNEIPWHDRVTTNENTDTAGTIEDLYQAFKARLIEEVGVTGYDGSYQLFSKHWATKRSP